MEAKMKRRHSETYGPTAISGEEKTVAGMGAPREVAGTTFDDLLATTGVAIRHVRYVFASVGSRQTVRQGFSHQSTPRGRRGRRTRLRATKASAASSKNREEE